MKIAGEVPVVDADAPYRNLQYQPLTEGIAYGLLQFIAADELQDAALGPDFVTVTDAVPNDIPLVSGLITEAFQTSLAMPVLLAVVTIILHSERTGFLSAFAG